MSDQPPEAPACPSYPSVSAQPAPAPSSGNHSYLLRLGWRSEARGRRKWRASLESPTTHEQQQFADLDSLFAFLRTMTESESAPARAPASRAIGVRED